MDGPFPNDEVTLPGTLTGVNAAPPAAATTIMRDAPSSPRKAARRGLLLRQRRALLAQAAGDAGLVLLDPQSLVPPAGQSIRPGTMLALLPVVSAEYAAANLPQILAQCPRSGSVAITTDQPLALTLLRQTRLNSAHYLQIPVRGSHIVAAQFPATRIAPVQGRADPALHLYLFTDGTPPALTLGIFRGTFDLQPPPAAQTLTPTGAAAPSPSAAGPDTATANTAVTGAVSLGKRLLAAEQAHMALYAAHQRLLAGGAPASASVQADPNLPAPPPRGTHGWKMATLAPGQSLGADPYDRRPDDAVFAEAQKGRDFMAGFALGTAQADPAAAAAALAERINRLAPAEGTSADVSIVIPVYGQLPYTLNCLDSLFDHVSRYSAEIIVIDDASPDGSGVHLRDLPQIRYELQAKNGGFIASCNRGGAMARGRYVVMLNNDTRVVPGWLDALIGSFAHFPNAGLIGGKMLYPDGSLQEAGGILWRDGSAWNYGRNDDPNRPDYCYARPADYISGCSVALTCEDWRQLGGFDTYFHPAYCEDADLAMRVRAIGKQVIYQPLARIIHYEGKTSGTDTGSGVKAYQVTNTRKFLLRWRRELSGHRHNAQLPHLEMHRSATRRMLVIDATTPTPDQDAGSLQTFLGLQSCLQSGYHTSFVPQDNFLFQPRYTPAMQELGIDCAYAPYELGMENYLRRYGHQFDVILVYRVTVLAAIIADIRRYAPQAVLLFHVADLHFLRMERQATLEGDAALAAEAASMRELELRLINEADCTITHSQVEADLLRDVAPQAPVHVWPLMFPLHGTDRSAASRKTVLFLGGYGHAPNVDAVIYFCGQIMPLLRARLPGLRFIIAGANPTEEVRALASADVEVTGQIPDLRDVMDEARVFVCPLRVGAGVKGKVMSALAYGVPVVSTAIGIEGSGLRADEHVLQADTPADFAAATLRLFADGALWQRLSTAGQRFIAETVAPASGTTHLDAAITSGLARKLNLPAPT